MSGDFVFLEEAAAFLRRSPATLRWWRHAGKGPRCANVGGRVVYLRADLDRWVESEFAAEDRVSQKGDWR
ncbi:MAG: helix-turn-helix domain-containing protein [Acidimicrobiia bacterium]|nr:helix-turn-helix domain-containing protein [Acidimicrobiia bacterium]